MTRLARATTLAALLAPLTLQAVGGCGTERPVYEGAAFDRDPPPVGDLRGKIVTSNSGDDTLSILDPEAPNAPARRLNVGASPVELEGPHHVAADPTGRFVYLNLSMAVSGSGSGPHGVHGAGDLNGWVVKLGTTDGREVSRVQVDPNPGDSALAPDGRTLYVTHYDLLRWQKAVGAGDAAAADSHLIAIDTDTMRVGARRPLCPAAHGVRLTPDGATLYATCGTDEIAVVDLRAPGLPLRRVRLPGGRVVGTSSQRCPYALSVAPDGSVWVSSLGPSCGAMGQGRVDVFDPAGPGGGAFDEARSATFRGSPVFASFVGPPEGFRAYVPEQGRAGSGDVLHVFDGGRPGEPLKALPAIALEPERCYQPHMMLVSADGRRGHLVCEGDHLGPGDFLWLDLEQGSVLGSVPIGVFPDGLALIPGG